MLTTVFRNGGSQAIRIPAQFRFEATAVDVEWDESLQALVVRPQVTDRWGHFFQLLGDLPAFDIPSELPMTPEGRLDVAAFMDLEVVPA